MSSELNDLLGQVAGGRSRAVAVRMRRLEAQVASARLRELRSAEAEIRVIDAVADWDDYVTCFKDEAEAFLVDDVPMLLVSRAWRLQGFAPPWDSDDPRYVALQILNRQPDEKLPADLEEKPSEWSWDVLQPTANWYRRRTLAVALLVLGPDGGARRREQLWGSSLVEQRGSDEACGPLLSQHYLTLGETLGADWDLINKVVPHVISSRLPQADGTPTPLSYAEVASLVADDRWREVLGSGQTRPDEDTDEEDPDEADDPPERDGADTPA